MREYYLETKTRSQLLNITNKISQAIRAEKFSDGICVIFVPHTTAGITVNENADPSVQDDLNLIFKQMVPADPGYRHLEGNSDAHAKATLVGSSLTLMVENSELQLGTWQGVYFCEFDGPRNRKFWVKLINAG